MKTIKNKSVPKSKPLIKDHKQLTIKCEFQTRLVISATKFSADFSKVYGLGLEKIFDTNNI